MADVVKARTLEDLAALTGVSRATVSRVLNGGPVAANTRDKVLEVMNRVGYRPHLAARILASGKSGVVGVVMPVPAAVLFSDPYYSSLLEGLTDSLGGTATGLMLWLSGGSPEETLSQILSTRFVDGIITTATQIEDPLVDGLLASDVPTVLIGHRPQDEAASFVDIDNRAAAVAIVEHLLSAGYRRIGHITGDRGTVSGEGRLAGYRVALDGAGIEDRFVVDGDYTEVGGYRGALQLLDRGVDAIFAASDRTAKGVYRAVEAKGLSIPGDVAVAGFDDLDYAAEMDPPLTTVRQDIRGQGVAAARALQTLLEKPTGPTRVILPTEVVVRASTAAVGRGGHG